MMQRWWKIVAAIAYLHPRQLLFWVWRRLLQPRLQCRVPPVAAPPYSHPARFCFLNHHRDFAAGSLTWEPEGEARLWVYNLHYFAFLHDEETQRSTAEKKALIAHWIAANPRGQGTGWEPYPVSLRLVNWLLWELRQPGRLDARARASAAEQAHWLSRNLERHILANHYLENLKALVFAGALLKDARAPRWLERGQRGLQAELAEQFLPDGGHYERSPSYHCLLVDGLLDVLELDRAVPGRLASQLVAAVRHRAVRGLELLAAIELPGDRYPLFNDSALDSAPRPSALYARARQLGLRWTGASENRLVALPGFGVFGLHTETQTALSIKAGPVGPDYQPGHTHCDLLSYEWLVEGQPVIVDTGVYQYQPGEMRRYVRSTAAHNTVAVAGAEQSEVWGEFRVGRRAQLLSAGMARQAQGAVFHGAIRAFPAAGWLNHRRQVRLQETASAWCLEVGDEVRGPIGARALSTRLLLHPDIRVVKRDQGCELYRGETHLGGLSMKPDMSLQVLAAPYCPEFGLRHEAYQLVMSSHSPLPVQLCYSLHIHKNTAGQP